MHELWGTSNKDFLHLLDIYHIQEKEEEIFGPDWLDNYAVETILNTEYDKVDVNEVISKQNYLSTRQNKIQKKTVFFKYIHI